jgi:glycosyltransferase involved in cell wall biosynthesis
MQFMKTAVIISYRLGGADGVSIEASKWAWALGELGIAVRLVAGSGPEGVDVIPGLGLEPGEPVNERLLHDALSDADLVVVENLCSLPLNPTAGEAVAKVLRGRRALFHHHDLPWHRADTAGRSAPPDDPAWRHVTISHHHAIELAERGITAHVLYNRFDLSPPPGSRAATRRTLDISEDEIVILQPTRALPRKNVPAGIALAEDLKATYWLTAAAEDGYAGELERLLARTSARVLRGQGPGSIHDAYAAADLVVLPSTWEGFGNPIVESIAHRRPLVLGTYPVAAEIRSLGFSFPTPDDSHAVHGLLAESSDAKEARIDAHLALARQYFDLERLPEALAGILTEFDR